MQNIPDEEPRKKYIYKHQYMITMHDLGQISFKYKITFI